MMKYKFEIEMQTKDGKTQTYEGTQTVPGVALLFTVAREGITDALEMLWRDRETPTKILKVTLTRVDAFDAPSQPK